MGRKEIPIGWIPASLGILGMAVGVAWLVSAALRLSPTIGDQPVASLVLFFGSAVVFSLSCRLGKLGLVRVDSAALGAAVGTLLVLPVLAYEFMLGFTDDSARRSQEIANAQTYFFVASFSGLVLGGLAGYALRRERNRLLS